MAGDKHLDNLVLELGPSGASMEMDRPFEMISDFHLDLLASSLHCNVGSPESRATVNPHHLYATLAHLQRVAMGLSHTALWVTRCAAKHGNGRRSGTTTLAWTEPQTQGGEINPLTTAESSNSLDFQRGVDDKLYMLTQPVAYCSRVA